MRRARWKLSTWVSRSPMTGCSSRRRLPADKASNSRSIGTAEAALQLSASASALTQPAIAEPEILDFAAIQVRSATAWASPGKAG